LFQRACLGVRQRARDFTGIPVWLRPFCGALAVWVIGSGVFIATRHLGVFGLGYEDLSAAFRDGIGWKIAGVLVVAKLIATIASYGSGGCGGIFSPTLFIGAMCGFCTAGIAARWLPLQAADHLVLAAVGMCCCFGAVVRAPVTGILMIFEMTHQFGMVPALMLGTLVGQSVARLAGPHNFYNALLAQDNHEIHKIAPPGNLAAWRAMPVRAFVNQKPVAITDMDPAHLRSILRKYSFRGFPVMIGGDLKGVVTRAEAERAIARGSPPVLEPPVIFHASQTLEEIDQRLLQSSAGLFFVTATEGGPVMGVFTLHDLLRAQAAVLD
jgi:CIC family chloride channel protein